ncbi:MAG: hypothetical protein ACREDR_13160, partial [Blastocatellia bacterium]
MTEKVATKEAGEETDGQSASSDHQAPEQPGRPAGPFRRFFKILGPGLITGASDDDPSGII